MLDTIRGLLRQDDGATMVEYAIMVALIAAVCITVVGTLGQSVNNAFANMNASL
jgi:pilus assembly protein Flp/PilA